MTHKQDCPLKGTPREFSSCGCFHGERDKSGKTMDTLTPHIEAARADAHQFQGYAVVGALNGAEEAELADIIARARAEAYAAGVAAERERCARVAEGWPVEAAGSQYQACGNGNFWDEGTLYDQGRADAAAAIRSGQ